MPFFLVKWIGIGLVIVGLAGAVWIQTLRVEAKTAQLGAEKLNTKKALEAAAAERMVRQSIENFNRQLEDQQKIAEADLAKLREESRHEQQQIQQDERDGKAVPLSDAGRSYFDRLRRRQASGDSGH